VLEWLQHLQLTDYYDALTADGYYSDINHVVEITWEDLEEIGIKKLGTCTAKIIRIKAHQNSHNKTHNTIIMTNFQLELG